MKLSRVLCWVLAALSLWTFGCMKMGPDFKKPDLQMAQPETFQYQPKKAALVVPEDRWWEVFGDPHINELVDAFFGTNARAESLEKRLNGLVQVLREHTFLLVWDNFESASGIAETEVTPLLTEDDRNILKKLIRQVRRPRLALRASVGPSR